MSLLALVELLDLHLEGEGIGELAALLGHTLALLGALLDHAKLGQRLARPMDETLAGIDGVLRAATVVLLVAEALAQATVTLTRAEVQGAEDRGAADVVPVGVLWRALATVGRLDELGAVGDHQLAFLLEVAGGSLDPAPRVHVAEGSTLALANASNLTANSDHPVVKALTLSSALYI